MGENSFRLANAKGAAPPATEGSSSESEDLTDWEQLVSCASWDFLGLLKVRVFEVRRTLSEGLTLSRLLALLTIFDAPETRHSLMFSLCRLGCCLL